MCFLNLCLWEASHVSIHVELLFLEHILLLLLLLKLFGTDKVLISFVAWRHATGGVWQTM